MIFDHVSRDRSAALRASFNIDNRHDFLPILSLPLWRARASLPVVWVVVPAAIVVVVLRAIRVGLLMWLHVGTVAIGVTAYAMAARIAASAVTPMATATGMKSTK
jgi:hypothetical protein